MNLNDLSKPDDVEYVKPHAKDNTVASYPALPLVQNNQRFFFATMPVDDIFPYCYVASRHEDPIEGFQRTLSIERANDIARYLDQSDGSIPTNIVLSAQEDAGLNYNSKNKLLRYRRVPRAFLILDGQHRMFGYGRTRKEHRVPVAIYEGLSRREEATLFIDINTTQRGVPAALLLDIKQVAQKESHAETILRRMFDFIASDPASPLYGLLSPSKSAAGRISRVTFNRGVSEILKSPVMTRLDEDKQFTLLRNYLRAIEQSLRNPSLLRKAAYFEAFCGIFDDIVRICLSKYRGLKEQALLDVVSPLKNVDLENILTGGKTSVTKASILPVLKEIFVEDFDVTEDMV